MMARISLFFVAAVCAAQENPWIILATQGNQNHEVHIGQSPSDSFTTFGAPRGANLAGHRVRAWKQGDRFYFTLAELKTRSGQVWDGESFNQVIEIHIGSAQLSPDFPSTIVGAYHFRLIRDPGGCGVTVPDIGNLTTSVQLDRIEYDQGICRFIVRNISSRNIVAVILGIQRGGSGGIEFLGATGIYETTDPTLRLLMAPGETARVQSHIGKPPGEPLNIGRYGPISLAAVIFDDESWDGDGKIAIGILARRAGFITQNRKFCEQIGGQRPASDRLAEIRKSIENLPKHDDALEERLIARYGSDYADLIKTATGSGMRETAGFVSNRIDELEKATTKNDPWPWIAGSCELIAKLN